MRRTAARVGRGGAAETDDRQRRNYAAHIAELNNPTPSEPFYFLKPTSCYVPPGEGSVVECPRGIELHHESAPCSLELESFSKLTWRTPTAELGVVIGSSGRDIRREDAMAHVAGYCLAIDYTGRNMQLVAKKKGLPWAAAKGFDTWWCVAVLGSATLR